MSSVTITADGLAEKRADLRAAIAASDRAIALGRRAAKHRDEAHASGDATEIAFTEETAAYAVQLLKMRRERLIRAADAYRVALLTAEGLL
jgi:uncharacterized protein (DUF2141 family)